MSEFELVDDMQHLSPETVEEYFRGGVAAAFPLSRRTQARLEIDPDHGEMRLLCPALGSDPDVAAYERISVERINVVGDGGDWFRLTVNAEGMHYEAYVLIESIVDQMRSGVSFRHAVSESLSGLKDLLANRQQLTEEKLTGLLGELLVLEHAIAGAGEDLAIAAWLGPLSEEHDFGFETYDAEVKTTRSEGRVHQIGTATQLQPAPDRTLYLISVQITKAGSAAGAFTLPELIRRIRGLLDRNRRIFDNHLESLGWKEADADLYSVRFLLRSTPRAYLVDQLFPAITSDRLAEVVPQRALVSSVSYRVQVTDLPFLNVPAPLDSFCEETN